MPEDSDLFSKGHDGAMVYLHGLCSCKNEDAATCRLENIFSLIGACTIEKHVFWESVLRSTPTTHNSNIGVRLRIKCIN
jgi:hypothetical protein